MLRQCDANVINNEGELLDPAALLDKLCSDCLEKEALGFSLRTAVGVNGSGNLALELQGLPFPVIFLKPVHQTDNNPTVLFISRQLIADMLTAKSPAEWYKYFSHRARPSQSRS